MPPFPRLFSGNNPSPSQPPFHPLSTFPISPPLAPPCRLDRNALNADIVAGIRLRKTRVTPNTDGNISSSSSSCFRGEEGHRVKQSGSKGALDEAPQSEVLMGPRVRRDAVPAASRSSSGTSTTISSPDPSPQLPAVSSTPLPPLTTATPTAIPTASNTSTTRPSSTASAPQPRRPPPPIPSTRPSPHRHSAPASSHAAPSRLPPTTRKISANFPPEQERPHTNSNSAPSYISASSLMSPALVAARKAVSTGMGAAERMPPEPLARPVRLKRERERDIDKEVEVGREREAEREKQQGDERWRFRGEEELPEPVFWSGKRDRVYRSGGSGSSVPLDWGTLV